MASWVINVHVRWLSKVHSRIKAELLSHDLMHADEVVDGFLPWSDKVPQECKLKPEVWEKVREMRDEPILNVDPAVFEDEVEYGPAEDEVLTLELPPERTQE